MSDTSNGLAFLLVSSNALGTYPEITKPSANNTASTWLLLPGVDVGEWPLPPLPLISRISLCPCKAKARFSGPFPHGSTGGAESCHIFSTGYFPEMAHFPQAQSCGNHLIMSTPLLAGRKSVPFLLCIFFLAWLTYRLE